ncbi:MAG TPA: hemerythrin domain-containing protein, partial [Planctomycetota bacterium]|nr:hemerythrin domain-containing protein [Planctomycetota bacterium]
MAAKKQTRGGTGGGRRSSAADRNEAVQMLKEDHRNVRKILKQLAETEDGEEQERTELLEEAARMIRAHAAVEEEIFYPAFLEAVDDEEDEHLYYEAVEEHHVVHVVLPEIEECDPASPEFAGKAKVLKDLIEHHIEEEENELLPKASKAIDRDELEELAGRMQERKEELEGAEAPAMAGRNGRRGERSTGGRRGEGGGRGGYGEGSERGGSYGGSSYGGSSSGRSGYG